MIRVKVGTELTIKNLKYWFSLFKQNHDRRRKLYNIFKNRDEFGESLYKKPIAKKLIYTSNKLTLGEGVSYTFTSQNEKQKKLFDYIVNTLFEKQNMMSEDITLGKFTGIAGDGYEMVFASGDDTPVPKCIVLPSENTEVIFDNTAEQNSLYAFFFDIYKNEKAEDIYKFTIYDDKFEYSYECESKNLSNLKDTKGQITCVREHHLGRVPITLNKNNDEEQGDFEQIVKLFEDRSLIHELAMADSQKIVQNILALINAKFAGNTEEEKAKTRERLNRLAVLELDSDDLQAPVDAKMLSKTENFGMIDVLAKDIDNTIYETTLIPNLSSEEFRNAPSGTAIERMLFASEALIAEKEKYIYSTLRRRLKMFVHFLTSPVEVDGKIIRNDDFEPFDVSDVIIKINRKPFYNLLELAQIVQILSSTQLFSNEFLVNIIPDADYQEEVKKLELEQQKNTQNNLQNPYFDNPELENIRQKLRTFDNE